MLSERVFISSLSSAIVTIVLCTCVSAERAEIYNTKSATTDLLWTKYPDVGGWEEVSGVDVDGMPIRYYQVCNSIEDRGASNWIRTPFITSSGANRVYVDVEFSVMECTDLKAICSETFNLYYYESDSDEASSTYPPWRENPYVKIDTIAAGEMFTDSEFNRRSGINRKTWTIGPLHKNGFYLAAQDKGACMSIMSLRVYYYFCPPTVSELATFPLTVAGDKVSSLVEVHGNCVEYANATAAEVTLTDDDTTPRYFCNSNGIWKVRTGSCSCEPGYQANQQLTGCEVCGLGKYKDRHGNEECVPCPPRSTGASLTPSSLHPTADAPSQFCVCDAGFYRMPGEDIHSPCTKPPSKPTSLRFHVNQTSISLQWSAPLDVGMRSDLFYSVACHDCSSPNATNYDVTTPTIAPPPAGCTPCGPEVTYSVDDPLNFDVSNIMITQLTPFTHYRIEVSAMNGVSSVSDTAPERAQVLAVTSEAEPSAVPKLHLLPNNFTLIWGPPLRPNGVITHYQILCRDVTSPNEKMAANIKSASKIPRTFETTNRTMNLTSLDPGRLFSVRVRAATSAGFGPFSLALVMRTPHKDDNQKSSPLPYIIGIGAAVCILSAIVSIFAYLRFRRKLVSRERMNEESSSVEKIPFGHPQTESLIVRLPSDDQRIYVEYPDPRRAVREFSCEIDADFLRIEETIGQGEFGEVCRGRLLPNSGLGSEQDVAVKRLKQGADAKDQLNFLKEASTMAQFSHPNVVQLKGVVTKSLPPMIVTEFMENGSLDLFLKKRSGDLSVLQLIEMLKGIASGMRYLSSMKYVHRDLAARNILVNSELVCKVSDFGLSRTLENDPHATYTTQGGKIAIRWTAPECIRLRKFTSCSDVWSYGIVMWEVMSYGEKPYWDMSNQEVIESIDEGYRLPAPYNCPVFLHKLMVECWAFEARNRPSMTNIFRRLEALLEDPSSLSERNLEAPTTPTTPNTPTSETPMPISIPA